MLAVMAEGPVFAVIVILLFAGASFFFSLAETSLFSLSKWQARALAERDSRAGTVLARLLGEPQDLLATIALGNTVATAAMVSTGLWMTLTDRWPMLLTPALLLGIILIGCEVFPKTMAVRNPERWGLRVARPMLLMQTLATPFREIAQKLNELILTLVPKSLPPHASLTDGDYQELLEMAYQQGALAESEKDIILQIIRLDRRTAKDVMRPRSQMAAISDDYSIEEMLAAARKYRHRRLPIYDETPDTIVGVLNTRVLLLDPKVDLVDAIEFPSFVPETMNLLHLLKSLQRQQRGLAIVLDEFGGTAGIVTLGDILEDLVGRLHSEAPPSEFFLEKLAPGRWRVSGTLRLDDFRREFPLPPDTPDVETMGGLLTCLLDVVPAPGEAATIRNLKLTAQTTDERRVRELLVEVIK